MPSMLQSELLQTPSKDKWERIGTKKRAGLLVPLFSVYSCNSLGIGEFNDIKFLVDWCKKTNNSIIQLLPMNEAGSVFCPYDSLSSFALEPSYLSIESLPNSSKIQDRISEAQIKFPKDKQYVDYSIKNAKMNLLWHLFLMDDTHESEEFEFFVDANSYWLKDFALYKVFKVYHDGKAWYEWPDQYKNRRKKALNNFYNEHKKKIIFQMWAQWLIFKQFKEAREYANKKGVLLKGDLPILVSRDSADVWGHPEYFKLDFAAGAPPDMYCAKGQRWGMPTYDWARIGFDSYVYLKEKLRYAQNFYDILRVDHVVGLFRIWSINYSEPEVNQGLHGFFDPHEESLWHQHGKNLLNVLLSHTNMLLCAEDLGIIPNDCPQTLKELGIPGNDVQRWVKDWNTRHDFLPPEEYRIFAVSMLSTHDTTNFAAWWENEAGTVDEALFIRKCHERNIDYLHIEEKLFDKEFSRYNRLRWKKEVDSADFIAGVLGKNKDKIKDFIEIYLNTYQEKEKLWKLFGLVGSMREKCDQEIVKAALNFTLKSASIFSIQLIFDWLYLTDLLKGDAYEYRINTPGTVNFKNWSLRLPISLEDLLAHKVSGEIRKMIEESGRI